MNFGAIVKGFKKAMSDNSPAILTTIGVTGTITTAVLSGKAAFKAADIIRDAEKRDYSDQNKLADVGPLDDRQKFELTWRLYLPAVGTGIITIACIITANRIGTRRAAALASAYTASQEFFKEYKDKVVEKIGENKEKVVREEIAQDQVNKNPPPTVVIGSGDHLCLDRHSGRYFNGNLEDLKKAANDTNYLIIHDGYASLSDYWDRVGLDSTTESDEIGWNTDRPLEVEYNTALSKDGRPCLTIEFRTVPLRKYGSLY